VGCFLTRPHRPGGPTRCSRRSGNCKTRSWPAVPHSTHRTVCFPARPAASELPSRSVLFNRPPPAWDSDTLSVNRNPDSANLDLIAQQLGVSGLPLSKSGAPFVSPAPQTSISPAHWLDVARLVTPNLVDYFTKTLPMPVFPSTPGKMPSVDSNPYVPGALFEVAAFLPSLLESGILAPLARGFARIAERAAPEAIAKTIGADVGARAPASPQIVTGPYGKLSGALPAGSQANHLNQNAVYKGSIPEKEGLSVPMKGNVLTDRDTPHYAFHQSLEQFWNQYREYGTSMPTNAEYGEAVQRALVAAGLTPAQASELAAQAAAQRAAHGLSEANPVPLIPRAIFRQRR